MSKQLSAAKKQRRAPKPVNLAQGINNARGKCEAMGEQCVFVSLQCNRHKCACCNKGVHAIGPCGNEQSDGTIICGLCEKIHQRDNAALNLNQQRLAAAALRKKQADPEKPIIGPRDHCFFLRKW